LREHLFKAKRLDNGIWAEGSLVISDSTCHARVFIVEEIKTVRCDPYTDTLTYGPFIEVGPSTVCEFTGLLDKNGKKIFEGDIVHVVCSWDSANMIVSYEACAFVLKTLDKIGFKYLGYMNDLEVIGSIHDKE